MPGEFALRVFVKDTAFSSALQSFDHFINNLTPNLFGLVLVDHRNNLNRVDVCLHRLGNYLDRVKFCFLVMRFNIFFVFLKHLGVQKTETNKRVVDEGFHDC